MAGRGPCIAFLDGLADETGDGHWMAVDQEAVHTAIDLSEVFPDKDGGGKSYVNRYRPGLHTLISRDPQGKPLKATLEIRLDAISADPFVETDPELSNWLTIPHGWRMLDDRLGIEVTAGLNTGAVFVGPGSAQQHQERSAGGRVPAQRVDAAV